MQPVPAKRVAEPEMMMVQGTSTKDARTTATRDKNYHVHVEARFSVGEYNIEVLSAEASTGLDALVARPPLPDSSRAPSRCCGRTSSRA